MATETKPRSRRIGPNSPFPRLLEMSTGRPKPPSPVTTPSRGPKTVYIMVYEPGIMAVDLYTDDLWAELQRHEKPEGAVRSDGSGLWSNVRYLNPL